MNHEWNVLSTVVAVVSAPTCITIINWPPPNASNLVSRIPPHISICRTGGYHAYMAGPCFDTLEQAIEYKDMYDRLGPAEMHRRRL